MAPVRCPKMLVRNYHYWLRNNPEECSSQLLRGGSLKLPIVHLCWVYLLIYGTCFATLSDISVHLN